MENSLSDKGLLHGIRVLETGPRLASAVTGRIFAELGADVIKLEIPEGDPYRELGPHFDGENTGGIFLSQNIAKRGAKVDLGREQGRQKLAELARSADLILSSWTTGELASFGLDADAMARLNPNAVLVSLTPFGLSGPRSGHRGTDLTVFHASGLAKGLIGPVVDPDSTPPVRASGEQSQFISGAAAACAGMLALYRKQISGAGAVIDISMQEALSFMDISGMAAPVFNVPGRPRKLKQVPGPNLTLLPACDGWVAISPREEHQWKQWLSVMGNPEWGDDPRFANRALREENSEDIQPLLAAWTRTRKKMDLFHVAQDNHVPCFPLMNPAEHLESDQLKVREYFRSLGELVLPGVPYKTKDDDLAPTAKYREVGDDVDWLSNGNSSSGVSKSSTSSELPLRGVRVTDLSWVIAGPTCTRYLASMGAEVVKVETSARPDPGRFGQLHDVLGQGKLAITLNLKSPEGLDAIKKLIASSDILVENFAPGVMDRLGLSWDVLQEFNPGLVMVSASGTGQVGPTRHVAAYGTLLQVYTGFAGLNGFAGQEPSIGMAWADPLCGMLLGFIATAALGVSRLTGAGRRVDFSMVEAMLATMPGPLLAYQASGDELQPSGNDDEQFFPHDAYHCAEEDSWVAIAVTDDREWEALAAVIGAPKELRSLNVEQRRERARQINDLVRGWTAVKDARQAESELQKAGVPAATSVSVADLLDDPHLNARGFFATLKDRKGIDRKMPSLPWQWQGLEEPQYGIPPGLGSDTAKVLRDLLGYSETEIAAMDESGALK
jgi:crotonobetainyl-CoA:carnitine CoA-transferase CaiB-like acyl-CoA transferase